MRDIQTREETTSHTRITVNDVHYYFHPTISLEKIAEATGSKKSLEKLANVIYNYRRHKFIKHWKNVNKLNGI